MTKIARRLPAAVLVGAAAAVSLTACGPTDITAQRLETSIATVFPNYYVQLQAHLGAAPFTATALHATASCDRGGPHVPDKGAGNDWICSVDWYDPVSKTHYTNTDPNNLASKFEVKINSNACYEVSSSTKTFGQLQIPDASGKLFTNPVTEFDGCFNVYDKQTSTTKAYMPAPASPSPSASNAVPSAPAAAAPTASPPASRLPSSGASPSGATG